MGSLGTRVLSTTVIALSCASLAGCSTQSDGPQADGAFHAVADATPNASAIQPQPGSGSTSDYRIMSGDVLQITVFQVQDFNRDAQVDFSRECLSSFDRGGARGWQDSA